MAKKRPVAIGQMYYAPANKVLARKRERRRERVRRCRLICHGARLFVNRSASAVWRDGRHESVRTPDSDEPAGRFDVDADSAPGTHPDELIAAALVRCFLIVLANELRNLSLHPELLEGTAVATADDSNLCGMISHLQLDIRAKVPGASQEQFIHASLAAKANAPIARLINTTISMTAHLDTD